MEHALHMCVTVTFQFYWYELHNKKIWFYEDCYCASFISLCPLDEGKPFFLSEYILMFSISYKVDVLEHEFLKYDAIHNCFFSFFHTY